MEAALATAVGLDIGGTNTKLALVSSDGTIQERRHIPTASGSTVEQYVQHIVEAIEELISLPGAPAPVGIGIGAPACNELAGTIEKTANLLFREPVPIRDLFAAHFGLPVFLVKDANASALGEGRFGGAQGLRHFALLTLGTGLGGGIVIDGKTVSGGSGLASEFGHTNVRPDGRQCGCGRRGCLETYVSATGLKRTVFELQATELDDSLLRRYSFVDLTAHDIAQAAEQGDTLAQKAFEYTGEILGRKIADLAVTIEPQAVFLSGGLAQAGQWLLKPAMEALDRHILSLMRGKVELRLSQLGANDAALLGAASLALYH